jgi:hypothetical protein
MAVAMSKTIADREQADAEKVGDAPDRGHERVLDGALPTLPCDRVGRFHEDKREIAPQERTDQEIELSLVKVK